jgi:prefoldin subunit 5
MGTSSQPPEKDSIFWAGNYHILGKVYAEAHFIPTAPFVAKIATICSVSLVRKILYYLVCLLTVGGYFLYAIYVRFRIRKEMLDDRSAYCVFFASVAAEFLSETGGKSLPPDAAKTLIGQGITAAVLAEVKITNPEHLELIAKAFQAAAAAPPQQPMKTSTGATVLPLNPTELAVVTLANALHHEKGKMASPHNDAVYHVCELEKQHEEVSEKADRARNIASSNYWDLHFLIKDGEVHIDCERGVAKESLKDLQKFTLELKEFGFDVNKNQLTTDLKFNDGDQFIICAVAVSYALLHIFDRHRKFLYDVGKARKTIASEIKKLKKEISKLSESRRSTKAKDDELNKKQQEVLTGEDMKSIDSWLQELFISLITLAATAKDAKEYVDTAAAQLVKVSGNQKVLKLCNSFIEENLNNAYTNSKIRDSASYKTDYEAALVKRRTAYADSLKLTKAADDLAFQIEGAVAKRDEIGNKRQALNDALEELAKNHSKLLRVKRESDGNVAIEMLYSGANVPNDRPSTPIP